MKNEKEKCHFGWPKVLLAATFVTSLTTLNAQDIPTFEPGQDVTHLLTNPNFSDKSAAGWTWDPQGPAAVKATDSGNPVITAYGGAFGMYQVVSNIPAGTYKLKVQAFSRPDSNDNTWSAYSSGKTLENMTYIFANDERQTVKLIVEEYAKPTSTSGWTELGSGSGKWIPNGSSAFSVAFSNGMYENEVLALVGADHQLKVGIRNESTSSVTYAGVDNFRLEYVGDENVMLKPRMEQEVKRLEAVASQAVDHGAFDAAAQKMREMLNAADVTAAQLEEQMTAVKNAVKDLLKTGKTESGQFNLTGMLQNPSFDSNIAGWDIANGTVSWKSAKVAGLVNVSGGERISQQLKDMPAGKYTLLVQAYYRPQGWMKSLNNYECGKKDEVKMSLFLNDKSVKVQHLMDGARSAVTSLTELFSTVDARGFGNNSTVGAEAFAQGDYWNSLEVEVGEDGDLTLGLELEATSLSDNWSTFDNFVLLYGEHKAVELAPVSKAADAYHQDYPVKADVTLTLPIKAGELTPLCVPFDIPASQFKAVYNVGSLEGSTCQLYPVDQVKSGVPCVVLSDTDIESIHVADAVLTAATADKRQLPWQGGLIYPYYTKYTWQIESSTGLKRSASALSFEVQDVMDMKFTANSENHRAHLFLNKVKYTQSADSQIETYNLAGPGRRDIPHAIGIPVPRREGAEVVVSYSTNASMDEAVSKTVYDGATMCYFANLIPGTHYYYEVKAGSETVSKGQFDLEGQLRMIYAGSVYNVRDLGGWSVTGNKQVRYGMIYRGAGLNGQYTPVTASDIQLLKDLGIGAEIDLRWKDGYDKDDKVGISAFGLTEGETFYAARANDYTAANLSETETQQRLKEEFQFILKNLREGRAVYYHCAFGADRTGMLTVLLEGLLGMTLDGMYKDYELTSFSAMSSTVRVKGTIQERIAVIQKESGSTLRDKFEAYFTGKLGVTTEEIEEFRSLMLYDPSATAINDVEVDNKKGADGRSAIYTLSGIRVRPDAAKQGIYVVKNQDGTVRKVKTL